VSPPWVPVLMFTLLGVGLVLIFLNYLGLLPALWWENTGDSDTSNWWLLIGLASILGGIVTATQYR
jgi:LPXTG-motif cell wall-anchored protein